MSSSKGNAMFRNLIVLCLAALACACASTSADKQALNPPLTPTEQFAITVSQAPDEILLAPHQDGLSQAQVTALSALVGRWRDAGAHTLTIKAPSGGQGQAYRSTAAIQQALEDQGVRPDQVNVVGYDAGPRPGAPIVVGFTGYRAEGPQCGRDWHSFTASHNNNVNSNFGCATTANMAAMIANPGDLLAPRPTDPADAGRREVVLGKYRQGTITSTPKDPSANGAVSEVGQ
jgi:pilus assembly protein CpaD